MINQYLRTVLSNNSVNNGLFSTIRPVQRTLDAPIRAWGGNLILSIEPSGSFAKGTAVRTGTDIDLFVSLSSSTVESLADIYDTLFNALSFAGYQPRKQNVSIGLHVAGHSVDIVPAKRQGQFGGYHSIYSNKADSWLQTNVSSHISMVRTSARLDEIRLLKIWRNLRGLDFPSFYLELMTIRALRGRWQGNLAANLVAALEFFRDHITTARIVDPANTNNVISDTLTFEEKCSVSAAAAAALESYWSTEFA
ncbi:nucleotidyltransferase domain-containing protein [Variovorax sp. PDNC026]|uniref:nucleotidyltransferase domain-containing protein n=1 Tax=Variovorax sp. PDNC026 TaxID=2811425 RepID=UPI001963B2CB|nr:nucleotidyltransferase [Variovorax sp. PDNC026]QRY30565.1 nucleotidyltransferase domain-containing protein [Variovorax sp. PDNC026]